jgi:hypothetical protein
MLNWTALALNASWITGLALLLATFSYARWGVAQSMREKVSHETLSYDTLSEERRFLLKPGLFWYLAGYLLLGIGLVGTAETLWRQILTALLIVLLIVNQTVAPEK